MPKCKGCGQERNELKNGLCIICIRGPGGKPVEVKSTPGVRYRGKVVKTIYKDDLVKEVGFSTGNEGVGEKAKKIQHL